MRTCSILHYYIGYVFVSSLAPLSGLLTTARPFDREKEPVIEVTVVAVDGGVSALSATVNVVVYIGDEDDEVWLDILCGLIGDNADLIAR